MAKKPKKQIKAIAAKMSEMGSKMEEKGEGLKKKSKKGCK
jgi:hypothetical protein